MAWTSTIVQKGIQDKAFLVAVSYTNGSLQFVEVLDLTGGSLQSLSDRVASRLATLETTQALMPQVTLGVFTPTSAVTSPLLTFQIALRALRNAQDAVTLGIITNTDTAYTTALSNAKLAFDPSFIGQF